MGQKKIAPLTGINKGFFLKKMFGRFARRPKLSGRNNEVTVLYRGGRKEGIHRIC